jgi:hypothetical protein
LTINMTIDLADFQQQVLHDTALQEPLCAITDRAAFVDAVVQSGRARGYAFTVEEVEAAMRANQRSWLERWIL